MDMTRLARLAAVLASLAACFALPLPVEADPWKDESGKGRKHAEWKDRGEDRGKGHAKHKGRDKAIERAWKHAHKRAQKRERQWLEAMRERRERAGRVGGQVRYVLPPSPRVAVTTTRSTAVASPAAVSKPAPRVAPRHGSTAVRAPATAGTSTSTSTDVRRREAVASYMAGNAGG